VNRTTTAYSFRSTNCCLFLFIFLVTLAWR